MYTFLILVAGLFILSAIIFRGKIKEHIFGVILIMFLGTVIGMVTVNGMLKDDIPFVRVLDETSNLGKNYSYIITKKDSLRDTIRYNAFIKYRYTEPDTLSEEKIDLVNKLDVGLGEWYYAKETNFLNNLSIHYLNETDTIARIEEWIETRVTKSHWVARHALPTRDTYYELYIPNDSIHNSLLNNINNTFYEFQDQTQKL